MKRKIRTWIKQNPVAIICLIAIVAIVCDTLLAFELPSRLTTAFTNIGQDAFWFLKAVEWLFLVAFFVFESERARKFLFNRTLGFYTCAAALFFAIAAHDLRYFSENHHVWSWDLGFDLACTGLLCVCGLVRGGDADWVEPEDSSSVPERSIFQTGLS